MKRIGCMMIALMLLLSLFAASVSAQELDFVTDAAQLLTDQQWEKLETMCMKTAEEYGCGVYIITMDECGEDPYDMAQRMYHEYDLGIGRERNGVLLLIGIEDRGAGLFIYGEDAAYAIDEYGALLLEEEYLPYLQEDEWYSALYTYVQTGREYLQVAEEGTPVRKGDGSTYLIAIGISFAVALIVCLILKAGMKNVHIKQEAGTYIAGGLNLTARSDRFTHRTETRTKIETKSSSTAKSGGGGHGRSAKF